jgi:hypothetical protein
MDEASKHAAIYALRTFNEKADKLESSQFVSVLESGPLSYHVKVDSHEGVGTAWRTGPHGESIDAFVVTLRQYLQKNDAISFWNIAQHYDELRDSGLVPAGLANDFSKARDRLNQFLDSEMPMMPITFNERRLTRRYIFDVFVNGAIAHPEMGKRDIYDQWCEVPFFFPMVENEFVSTMGGVLSLVFYVRNINARALEILTARNP